MKNCKLKVISDYPINGLFNEVVKVKMFNQIWLNGQDGFYYCLTEEKSIANNQYLGTKQPISFVYNHMQAGYNLHGSIVCLRKNAYGKRKLPLKRVRSFRKNETKHH